MSKYLVTGVLGFIGSYFAKYIINNESDSVVIGVNRNSNQKNFKRLEDLESNPRFQLIFSDLAKDDITELCDDVDYITNFAAKTFVDHSIRSPEPFVQDNIIGTFRLLEVARKSTQLKKYIQVSCYDEKTRALTPNGLKKYNELKIGDLVFSLNPVTQEIELKPIEKVITQSYDGKMIRFKNKRIDLLVTPNHNMFFLNTSKNKLLIQSATEMAKRSITIMNKPENLITFIDDYNIRPGHDRRYALNVEKLKATGWKSEYTIDEGFEETVNWYLSNRWWFL